MDNDDSYFNDDDDIPIDAPELSNAPGTDTMDDVIARMLAAEASGGPNPPRGVRMDSDDDHDDGGRIEEGDRDQSAKKSTVVKSLAPLPRDAQYGDLMLPELTYADNPETDLQPNSLRAIESTICSNALQRSILSAMGRCDVDVVVSGPAGSGKSWASLQAIAAYTAHQGPYSGPHALILVPSEKAGRAAIDLARSLLPKSVHVLEALGSSDKRVIIEAMQKHKKANHGGIQEVVIGTPGRIIDLLSMKLLKLVPHCASLVIENTDAYVTNGDEFARQIATILGHMRPDRVVMCIGRGSAFGRKLSAAGLFRSKECYLSFLPGQDRAIFFENSGEKWDSLCELLTTHGHAKETVVVFVADAEGATALAGNIEKHTRTPCAVLHGKVPAEDATDLIEALCHRKTVRVCVATDDVSLRVDVVISFDLRAGGRMAHRTASARTIHYSLAAMDSADTSLVDVARAAVGRGEAVPPAMALLVAADKEQKEAELKNDRLYNSGQSHKGGIGFGKALDPTKESVVAAKITEVHVELPTAAPKVAVVSPFGHRLFTRAPLRPTAIAGPYGTPAERIPTEPPPRVPYQRQRSPSSDTTSSSSCSSSSSSSSSRSRSRRKKHKKHKHSKHKHKKRKSDKH